MCSLPEWPHYQKQQRLSQIPISLSGESTECTHLTKSIQSSAPRFSFIGNQNGVTPSYASFDDPLRFECGGNIRVGQAIERKGLRGGGSRRRNSVGGEERGRKGLWEGVGELVVLVSADEVGLRKRGASSWVSTVRVNSLGEGKLT